MDRASSTAEAHSSNGYRNKTPEAVHGCRVRLAASNSIFNRKQSSVENNCELVRCLGRDHSVCPLAWPSERCSYAKVKLNDRDFYKNESGVGPMPATTK